MRVHAFKSFVAVVNGRKYRVCEGDVVDMPDGADWIRAGLVEEAEPGANPDSEPDMDDEKIETATALPAPETATGKPARRSRPRAKR